MDYPTDNVSYFRLSCIGQRRQPNSVPVSRPKLKDCATALGWASSPAQISYAVQVVPLAPNQTADGPRARRGYESVEHGFGPGVSVLRGRSQLERTPSVTPAPTNRSRAIEVALVVHHHVAGDFKKGGRPDLAVVAISKGIAVLINAQ